MPLDDVPDRLGQLPWLLTRRDPLDERRPIRAFRRRPGGLAHFASRETHTVRARGAAPGAQWRCRAGPGAVAAAANRPKPRSTVPGPRPHPTLARAGRASDRAAERRAPGFPAPSW